MAIFGQKTPILAIFMAQSRHTGIIQLDITYMNITTPFHAQKTLRNLVFEFPRGSLLFSWHCAPSPPKSIQMWKGKTIHVWGQEMWVDKKTRTNFLCYPPLFLAIPCMNFSSVCTTPPPPKGQIFDKCIRFVVKCS